MPVAKLEVRAVCPHCGRIHGRFAWERAWWVKHLVALTVVDGGPVFTVPLLCPACERALSSRCGSERPDSHPDASPHP